LRTLDKYISGRMYLRDKLEIIKDINSKKV